MMLRTTKCLNSVGVRCYRNFSENRSELPESSRVVIAGSGAVSNSVAYHLVKNGWKDILVLEQNTMKSGTSHYCTGVIGLFKPEGMRRVILNSLKTYEELQNKLGYNVGLVKCGSLNLAQSPDRMIALKRRMSYNKPSGLHCDLLSPKEITNLHPYLNVEDLQGGVYVPDDAIADPHLVTDALIDFGMKNGVKYRENCQVQYIQTDNNDNIVGVETSLGVVKCEYFVNCAGMWARELGMKSKKPVRIPAYPGEHYYAITSGMKISTDQVLPCVRDYDASSYSRQFNDEMLIGWFEHNENPAFTQGQIPKNWQENIKENFPNFDRLWDKAVNRVPELKNCASPFVASSPDNFTPDGRWIVGESSEVNNYFVAVGTNGNSVQGAGGLGQAVAEWIIEGQPTQDTDPFSIQRFLELHSNRRFLSQRVREVIARHYAISYPFDEYKFGRQLRCSPLYKVLEQRRGVFGTIMAYERALYFDTTHKRGEGPPPQMPLPTYFKPKFFKFLKDEFAACTSTVGIIDISSFSKIKIKSSVTADVVNYLQKLCCNDVDIDVGTCIKTGMLNKNGGFENECIIVRQRENSFFMISPSSQQTRIYEWMSNHLPSQDRSIKLSDQTSMLSVLNVVGPKALMLMQELTNSDVNIPPFCYRKLNVGYASNVQVMSYTHTGEPGFCLYVPSEYTLHLYDDLMRVGLDYGAKDCGTLTQKFMRIERFIPLMGDELNSNVTPLEAGLDYVNFDNKDFIGRDALLKQRQEGITKRLVMFILEDHNPDENIWCWGSEPIYRNSEYVGTVTSAGFGFTSGKFVCLGFIQMPGGKANPENITNEFIMDTTAMYHIDVAGRLFSATPYIDVPPFIAQREKDSREAGKKYRPSAVFSVKQRQ